MPFLAYVIQPNLGCPALVNGTANDLVFQAIFASDNPNLDLKSVLDGNLFLQRLEDTQTVIQKVATAANYITWANPNNPGVLAVAHWPDDVKSRLIPLEVVSFNHALDRPVTLGSMTGDHIPYHFAGTTLGWQYPVTLRILPESISLTDFLHLFNLVQVPDLAPGSHCRINYHAVYIHKQEWHNFSFLHITDSHIAWRNDFIPEVIDGSADPDFKKRYCNWNQQFRNFIAYANSLHRAELIDFIVLTGDIVDYGVRGKRFYNGDRVVPYDNFELFLQLVTGWPNCDQAPGEELEVPIFTCPGNHDYRPAEYPLYGKVKFNDSIIHLFFPFEATVIDSFYDWLLSTCDQWRDFGLTEQEASRYASITVGDSCPTYYENQGIEFLLPADSLVPSYRGLLNPEPDYTIWLGKHRILCMDTGRDAAVITSVTNYLSDMNSKSRLNLKDHHPDAIGFTDKQIEFIKTNMGAHEGLVILACHAPILNYKGGDRCFSYDGPRDPDYGYSVATNNFDAFVATLYQDNVKHIDLILSGHTHNHREFEFKLSSTHGYRYRAIKLDPLIPSPTPTIIGYDIDEATILGLTAAGHSVYRERCYQIEGDIFSNWLAHAPDKTLWWSQQPAYLIQTPSISTSDILRVVVENDVITDLQRLKTKPNILSWLSVLLLEPTEAEQNTPLWLSTLLLG